MYFKSLFRIKLPLIPATQAELFPPLTTPLKMGYSFCLQADLRHHHHSCEFTFSPSNSLHCTLLSFNPFFFLTTRVCLNKETLLASNIFYVFSHSLLLPFSQQKSSSRAVFAPCEGSSLSPGSSLPTRPSNHGFCAAPCTAAKTEERRIKAAVNK